jgi:hypothetical protein
MRVRRGTLPSTEIDGHRVVLLPRSVADQTGPNGDTTTIEREASESELLTQLRSEVAYLRQTLDAEIEARRRADHLVAGMIDERRGLMDQIAALTAGAPIEATEQRPNVDRTQANAGDHAPNAAVAANEGPGEAMAAAMTDDAPRPNVSRWGRFWRGLTGR